MPVLQIVLSEKQEKYARSLLDKFMGKFMYQEGYRFTYGSTLVKVLEDYALLNGYIDESVADRKAVSQKALIKGDEEELEYIHDLIETVSRTSNVSSSRLLQDYIIKCDPHWRLKTGKNADSSNKQIIERAVELFGR